MAPRARRARTAGAPTNFGPIVARVNALKQERAQVVSEINGVIATAHQMLQDIGELPAGSQRGASRPKGVAKKRRRLSPEGRARFIAAAKKRWAKYNKEKKAK